MATARFQWQPTFRVPSDTVAPGMFAHPWAKLNAVAPPGSLSCFKVTATMNMARVALGSARVTRFPELERGSLPPIRCSLNIAVFEVPSVTDWVPTAPPLFELLYHGFWPG